MSFLARLRAYPAHPDERVAACNVIALVVAGNQPFYPFYVFWFVGGDARVACWTFLSTPFFLAVPWIARKNALAGRALLVLAGIGNTLVSAKAFGTASGVELFLMPCAMIAGLAFRQSERAFGLAGIGLALVAFLLLHDRYGAPLGAFDTVEYARFLRLNAYSVATLAAFIALGLGSVQDRASADVTK
jgi:hypothetical protein